MKFLRRRILPVFAVPGLPGAAGGRRTNRASNTLAGFRIGVIATWSLSGGLPAADLDKAQAEPRILFRLAERNLYRASVRIVRVRHWIGLTAGPRRPRPRSRDLKIDWSVPLGAGIVAPYMFPAKYSFDINETPNCTNDYVVFGLNVAGATGGQANVIGLKNLYSGAAPAGLCPGAGATFYWGITEALRRLGADLAGGFTGRDESRVCRERCRIGSLSCPQMEVRGRHCSYGFRRPDS